ncbi:MAG TPA: anti-sigma factor [Bryobacteraceae bacterium]|nr:anti-sigma factor [Bryobacteraceae bacterium]
MTELNAYLDEETSPEERARLQSHINECPNCWVVVDTTQKTLRVYKGVEPQVVPQDVSARLMAALQRKMAEKKGCC